MSWRSPKWAIWAWISVSASLGQADSAAGYSLPTQSTQASFESSTTRAWILTRSSDIDKGYVVLMHGCSGLFTKSGSLQKRFKEYAPEFLSRGYSVVLIDSFSARGRREICTQPYTQRSIRATDRAQDIQQVLNWMGLTTSTSNRSVTLVGWSNGASSLLETLHQASQDANWIKGRLRISGAVAFYPGCNAARKNQFSVGVPLLLMTGALDDWTPEEPCRLWAETRTAHVQHISFQGAFHGFDGSGPVRLRTDVPNGVNPGQGVHVGGQPEAKEASRQALWRFLQGIHSVS